MRLLFILSIIFITRNIKADIFNSIVNKEEQEKKNYEEILLQDKIDLENTKESFQKDILIKPPKETPEEKAKREEEEKKEKEREEEEKKKALAKKEKEEKERQKKINKDLSVKAKFKRKYNLKSKDNAKFTFAPQAEDYTSSEEEIKFQEEIKKIFEELGYEYVEFDDKLEEQDRPKYYIVFGFTNRNFEDSYSFGENFKKFIPKKPDGKFEFKRYTSERLFSGRIRKWGALDH